MRVNVTDMINEILTGNKLGRSFSKRELCDILTGVSGRKVAQNYITRWLAGSISNKNYNLLKEVHSELCDR